MNEFFKVFKRLMGIGEASSGNDAITLNNNGALVNDQNVVSEERACYFSTVADEIGGRDNLSFSEDDFTLHPSVNLSNTEGSHPIDQ